MKIFRRSFRLTEPKYIIGEHFGVSEKFFYRKFSCIGGGHHGFVGTFCLTGPKRKALYRNPSVFRKFSGIEKNLWKRGGISQFSVEIFMSHSAASFRKEILLFLRKFLVSKSFMDEKGGITFFRRKFLVSQCRKLSWGNPTVFEKIFGFKKFYGWEGGYHVFPSKIFGPTVLKNFVGIPSMFQKIWGIEKFYA